jgi:hypothetical protein
MQWFINFMALLPPLPNSLPFVAEVAADVVVAG